VGAEEDELIFEGGVGAGDLGDDVGDGDVLPDAVGEGEVDGDGSGLGIVGEEAFEEGGVFGADLGFGDGVDGGSEIEGSEDFGAVGVTGGEDSGGAEGAEAVETGEDLLGGGLFAEGFGVEEDDGTADFRGGAVEDAGGE